MKTKPGFRLTNVCGVNIDFSNIISMNDTAKFLWEKANAEGKDFTEEELAKLLVDNYEMEENVPLPYEQALADVKETVKAWKEAGIVTD